MIFGEALTVQVHEYLMCVPGIPRSRFKVNRTFLSARTVVNRLGSKFGQ